MILWRTTLIFVLGGFAFCPMARAATPLPSRNPYRRIFERNIFRLKPAPPPHNDQPLPSLPKITLTGITTILGDRRALLKIQFPAHASEKAKEESCILTEGQRNGPIQVLHIDVKAGRVKVDNSGTVVVLTFEKNGPSPPGNPLPPAKVWPPRRWVRTVSRETP